MTRTATRQNAESNIEIQKKLAAEGKDFCPGVIIESEHLIELANEAPEKLTEEEKERLKAKAQNPNADYSDCKDIKERLGISWNDLKKVAGWIN